MSMLGKSTKDAKATGGRREELSSKNCFIPALKFFKRLFTRSVYLCLGKGSDSGEKTTAFLWEHKMPKQRQSCGELAEKWRWCVAGGSPVQVGFAIIPFQPSQPLWELCPCSGEEPRREIPVSGWVRSRAGL